MSPRDKDKEFQKLQSMWYAKLKDEGFDEIENPDGNLKSWHSFMFARRPFSNPNSTHRILQEEEYYRLAGQFFYDHKFKNKTEKRMWELHSNGKSVRDIAKIITKESGYTYKRKVDETLRGLAKEMLKKCRNQE